MNKANLNFVIDALMFLCMTAIAELGFLMKYVLLPGRESTIKYGRRVDLSFLGLDRHDWGAIHLYLGFLLLALLVLHIVLHWNMIPGLYARLVAPSRQRWQIAFVYVLLTAALLLFPFLISPEVKGADAGRGGRAGAHGEIGPAGSGAGAEPYSLTFSG
jgi:polyferredoxin